MRSSKLLTPLYILNWNNSTWLRPNSVVRNSRWLRWLVVYVGFVQTYESCWLRPFSMKPAQIESSPRNQRFETLVLQTANLKHSTWGDKGMRVKVEGYNWEGYTGTGIEVKIKGRKGKGIRVRA